MSRIRNRDKRYKNPYGKAKFETPDDDNMEGVTVLAIFTFFMSCFYSITHFMTVDMGILGLFKLFCFMVGASFLIPVKVYRKWLTMSIYEYIIFNIISLAPLFCSSFFILNNMFASDVYIESYKVIDIEVDRGKSYYILENKQYEDEEYLRTINNADVSDVKGSDSLKIYFSDGLFGLREVRKKEVI